MFEVTFTHGEGLVTRDSKCGPVSTQEAAESLLMVVIAKPKVTKAEIVSHHPKEAAKMPTLRTNFLHTHIHTPPSKDHEHVVVDRADWEEAMRILFQGKEPQTIDAPIHG
ncbi:MAG: hypothetical protein M0R50_11440 [Candidatus Cloacimonetes bacterium]|jgi:hypothetical protein|nr:hypothetical protein [Candidatus Cloacimonadota bacterium]